MVDKMMMRRFDLAKKVFVALMLLQMIAMTMLVTVEPNPKTSELRRLGAMPFENATRLSVFNVKHLFTGQQDLSKGAAKHTEVNLDDDHDDWVSDEEDGEEWDETEAPTKKKDNKKNVAAEEQKVLATKEEDEEAEDEGEWESDDDVSVDEDDTVRATEARRNNKYPIAGLNCDSWGGPARDVAQEMVYWEDIPQDAIKVSPFLKRANGTNNASNGTLLLRQFMTFEMDNGGWNNMRMAMETMLGIALATGRTLVLPPRQRVPHFEEDLKQQDNHKRQTRFSFDDFFHMEKISKEYAGLKVIQMHEFLELVMTGRFVDPKTLQPIFPPKNRTKWNGASWDSIDELNDFLRNNITNTIVSWDPNKCIAAFPQSNDPNDLKEVLKLERKLKAWQRKDSYEKFINDPVAVDGTPLRRLKENSAGRSALCIYTPDLQEQDWLHFPVMKIKGQKTRYLVYFYAFLFFQDWRQDLWVKRFIRDHVRYVDEIQCAAARMVQALRKRASQRDQNGEFYTMHVRRGDFKEYYEWAMAGPKEIYRMLKKNVPAESTLYIATDEKDKSFFDVIKKHYDVVFMDDLMHLLDGINPNFYGNIDQLVASKGRIFYGCYSSTFTGYITRLRGYHADAMQIKGYELGITPSYYYVDGDDILDMQHYYPVVQPFWEREFPASWRLIDTGVDEPNQAPKNAAVA